MKPRVILLRGHSVAPWDLRPHELLTDDYELAVLVSRRNLYGTSGLGIEQLPAESLTDPLPGATVRGLASKAAGERFLGLEQRLRGAEIVHVAELGNWYSAQAAALKRKLGFKLLVTTWETLPLRSAYRNIRTRPYARRVIAEGDRFLAATARARDALLLEGVEANRIEVCPPGVDLGRFATARDARPPADGSHMILSAGRLVWEKGHQDVIRALALLRLRGAPNASLTIVGDGPEGERLERLAADLGLAGAVDFRASVAYDEMPVLYAQASCLVLASIPVRYWEEQFGMVLAEAMAGGVPIVCSTSGAIPEVVGPGGLYFAPGDWVGLADALQRGPLAFAPGRRTEWEADRIGRFSTEQAAARLRGIYADLLATGA